MGNGSAATIEKLESLQQECLSLRQQNADLQAQGKRLMEQLRLATHRRFGASSERSDANQLKLDLFNEAEAEAQPGAEEPTVETITYERRKKQPGQREAMLGNLPVERIEYRLSVYARII